MDIQNEAVEFEENMPLTVFRKGDLMAFRESDRYCLNIIELTNNIDFKRMTPRSKVKGNILTLHSEDEEDVVIFQREDKWKGGYVQFAYILRTEKKTKWCKLMQQDLLQKRESSLQSTKLDLKKFVRLFWPSSALWS